MRRGHKGALTDLTAKFVREIFDYDPSTGNLRWKVSLSKRAPAGKLAGFAQKKNKGRIKVGIKNKDYMVHRIIWLWVTGSWPELEIDHLDENPANNRWNNLRHATPKQNHYNVGPPAHNTSGFKGVTYVKKRKCFIAGIKVNGKRKNLGSFATAEAAYASYCAEAKQIHGKFAKL